MMKKSVFKGVKEMEISDLDLLDSSISTFFSKATNETEFLHNIAGSAQNASQDTLNTFVDFLFRIKCDPKMYRKYKDSFDRIAHGLTLNKNIDNRTLLFLLFMGYENDVIANVSPVQQLIRSTVLPCYGGVCAHCNKPVFKGIHDKYDEDGDLMSETPYVKSRRPMVKSHLDIFRIIKKMALEEIGDPMLEEVDLKLPSTFSYHKNQRIISSRVLNAAKKWVVSQIN